MKISSISLLQFKVNTQMNKVYDENGGDYTALVAKGCLCLYRDDSRNVIILNTAQVFNHGKYLEISSQEIECGHVCLSFREQADLGFMGHLDEGRTKVCLSLLR